MSPRVRQVTDAQVLAVAAEVVGRLGRKMTLADVAAASGIAAATLVQRFGSKRAMELAIAEHANGVGGHFTAARSVHASPLEALLCALAKSAEVAAPDPQTLVNRLVTEHSHLDDPDFHRVLAFHRRGFVGCIRTLLDDAVDCGELRACDTGLLAETLHATYEGALRSWTCARGANAAQWVRRRLEFLLESFRN